MKKKKLIKCLVIMLVIVLIFNFSYAAGTPTLVNKLNSALKKILSYLEKLATPAAAVAIATGVMIRKFSFGDEEKLVIGKRVIVNAIIGYAIILLIDYIIKFVEALV